MRALLGTASRFCEVVVFKLRTAPIGTALSLRILRVIRGDAHAMYKRGVWRAAGNRAQDRVLDGPASEEKGSKGVRLIGVWRAAGNHQAATGAGRPPLFQQPPHGPRPHALHPGMLQPLQEYLAHKKTHPPRTLGTGLR